MSLRPDFPRIEIYTKVPILGMGSQTHLKVRYKLNKTDKPRPNSSLESIGAEF